MFRSTIIVLCLAGVFGVSNALHASCAMTITVSGESSSTMNASIVAEVKKRNGYNDSCVYYSSDSGEVCGYSLVSAGSPLHIQHETPVKHYVDDITMSFKDSGSDCVIDAKSESEPSSYYDYDTNFCNIFNLFRSGTAEKLNYDISISYGSCEFHPSTTNGYDDAYSQCNTY